MQVKDSKAVSEWTPGRSPGMAIIRWSRLCWALAVLLVRLVDSAAWAQYPPPRISDLGERSGLMMRFAGVPEYLPPIRCATISTIPDMPTRDW